VLFRTPRRSYPSGRREACQPAAGVSRPTAQGANHQERGRDRSARPEPLVRADVPAGRRSHSGASGRGAAPQVSRWWPRRSSRCRMNLLFRPIILVASSHLLGHLEAEDPVSQHPGAPVCCRRRCQRDRTGAASPSSTRSWTSGGSRPSGRSTIRFRT